MIGQIQFGLQIYFANNEKNLLLNETKDKFNQIIIELKCEELQKNINNNFESKIRSIEPLPINITSSEVTGFIPLKNLIGMNYEKIIGCYVIHNIEKNKYYVGQSKDVIKRITKDHFTGTKVKNIIFAEDYFSSQFKNKDDLFEVKIIRCQTKDELYKLEKMLIEQYDSFNNGYNGTGGNS